MSKLELRVMEVFWAHGALAVRQAQEKLSEDVPPAYTTVQTVIYRLEAKGALRRTRKISNAHIFEAAIAKPLPGGIG
ncbi:MAG TPA: BlaI/MecI/CopY family transcriptional regulator [Rhizomicrobium sp.]|nr:BlaI/MecI/CopY family transcriptional regulator [Rhizomicrobium sp.]